MAQASGNIQNDTFPNVRAEINDNLAALFSTSSGPSAPAPNTTKPHQLWVDTSTDPPVLKIRDGSITTLFHPVGVLDSGGFKPSGVTPIANGGTGQTTVAAAIAALLPSQTGNADKALVTNGTSLLWGAITASSFTKYTFAAGTGTGSTRTHLWTKPSTGSTAVVLIWGGGGAGGADNSEGGGGGAGSNCGFGLFPLADLGATETITLGRGGQGDTDDQNGANGTNSTFGSHVTSYGGRGGDDDDGDTAFGSTPFGRGNLGTSLPIGSEPFVIFSGGNGGTQGNTGTSGLGGNAIFGGAGGGSSASDKAGGTSLIAGNGGAGRDAASTAFNGSTPGGGGGGAQSGTAGSGGDGECWVLIF